MRRLRTELFAAAGLLAGCGSGPQAPHGSPVLLAVYWVAGGTQTPIYLRDADASVATSVPGGSNEVDFVFDRRLDGSRVEDTVGDTTVPKANPPITVSWPPGPAIPVPTSPPFDDVFYNSLGTFGDQSSFVFLRPRVKGFPSSTLVTFTLDKNGLTSAYGEPMDGPGEITAMVEPLAILPRASPVADALETLPASVTFPVRFSNRPGPVAMATPFAHARTGGAELPITLATDATDPAVVYVSAARCLGGWPPGATVDVTFATGFPDAFGVPTTAELAGGSFTVSGGSGAGDGGSDAGNGGATASGDAAAGGSCDGPTEGGAD